MRGTGRDDADSLGAAAKSGLRRLFSRLTIYPDHIQTALAREPVASASVFVEAPPDTITSTGDRVLVEGVVDLPETPWMLTAGELQVLYLSHGLNTWQIARLARVSHSTIVELMRRYGIERPAGKKQRPKYFSLLAALLA